MAFKPEPIVIGGVKYWGVYFCDSRGGGGVAKRKFLNLAQTGKAYLISDKDPDEIGGAITIDPNAKHYDSGRRFFVYQYVRGYRNGAQKMRPTTDYPVLVRAAHFQESYDASTGKGSNGAIVVVPNQGFGLGSACGDRSFFGVINNGVREVGEKYDRVIQAYDQAIASKIDIGNKKSEFVRKYGNYTKVSYYSRQRYLREIDKELGRVNTLLVNRGSGPLGAPIPEPEPIGIPTSPDFTPVAPGTTSGPCGATENITQKKQLINQALSLLKVLSSPPYHPSTVVSSREGKKIKKKIKQLEKTLGCDKKIQGIRPEELQKQIARLDSEVSNRWIKLLSPAKRGARYNQVEMDLKQKAASIREVVDKMARIYKVVLHYKFQIPFPGEIKFLQSYLESPDEAKRQKLVRLSVSRVKSSGEEYLKRFELQVRRRLLYAVIRIAKRVEARQTDSGKRFKLGSARRLYEKLVKNPEKILTYKGDLDSFFIWAKGQVKRIKRF